MKRGFLLGNLFAFGNAGFAIASLIFAMREGADTVTLLLSLMIALLLVGLCYGLWQRRRWALRGVSALLLCQILLGGLQCMSSLLQGLIMVGASFLWLQYFRRRKELFS